jgi:hypothetical protein
MCQWFEEEDKLNHLMELKTADDVVTAVAAVTAVVVVVAADRHPAWEEREQ